MKNSIKNKNGIIRRIVFLMLISITFFFQSCETEIPINDTDSPAFSFNIIGDGFEYTFTEVDDYSNIQLNLNNNTEYKFIYTGNDQGGLKLMELTFQSEFLELQGVVQNGWTITDDDFRNVTWNGDVNNPLTGAILTGTFRTHTDDHDKVGVGIYFNTYDFNRNQTFRHLDMTIAKQGTGIVPLN